MTHPLAEKFAKTFGAQPDLMAQAPGRVNLIGEHIDYSQGFVLPFAIDLYTSVAIRIRNDGIIRIASSQRNQHFETFEVSEIKPGYGNGWVKYPLGVLWALKISSGADIFIDGKVPSGAGLSSSAALECSIAFGLNELFSLGKTLKELALLTQKAENDYVGVPCGIMDQSISLMGKSGNALLIDCRDLNATLIPLDLARAGLQLLIIDTGVHHALVDGGYAERRASCESAANKIGVESMRQLSISTLEDNKEKLSKTEYLRARHAVTEIARVLETVLKLEDFDYGAVGALLNDSHFSLRDDYTVSCPESDLVVNTANTNGALGARMVGGGFGGSVIALIDRAETGKISIAIEQAFANAGYKPPRFFTSLPSDGASLIN
ncbi:galactokinase [Actinomycetes bacterium]|nr:galactokinase [Actinomycetes bacterium]